MKRIPKNGVPFRDSNIVKKLFQKSVILTDLDGLLVNSEHFNQVFVQRTDPDWIRATINRVVRSELHLKKLIQVLLKFIVSERHPEWERHALMWFKYLINSHGDRIRQSPAVLDACRPLLAYATRTAGLCALYQDSEFRGSAVEKLGKSRIPKSSTSTQIVHDGVLKIPSTGYVFVDDSDDERRPRRIPSTKDARGNTADGPFIATESVDNVVSEEGDRSSVYSGGDGPVQEDDELSGEDDEASGLGDADLFYPYGSSDSDLELAAAAGTSDDGVFDVHNETASSFEDQSHDVEERGTSDEDPSETEKFPRSSGFSSTGVKRDAKNDNDDDDDESDAYSSDSASKESCSDSEQLELLRAAQQDSQLLAPDEDEKLSPNAEAEKSPSLSTETTPDRQLRPTSRTKPSSSPRRRSLNQNARQTNRKSSSERSL